jgi:hypothetical protein
VFQSCCWIKIDWVAGYLSLIYQAAGHKAGMFSTEVVRQKDGTYNVVGGAADGDKNVYVVDNEKNLNRTAILGQSVTDHSFLDDHGKAIIDAKINLTDNSGADFLNNDIIGDKSLTFLHYINNAKGGEDYDFKTNNIANRSLRESITQYEYRGMAVNSVPGLNSNDGSTVIASARDIGNIGAGYIAGSNGLNWQQARLGFDALQSVQDKKLSLESPTSQLAEKVGFNLGVSAYKKTNPWASSIFPTDTPFPAH